MSLAQLRSIILGFGIAASAVAVADVNGKVSGVITFRNGSEVRTIDIEAKESSSLNGRGKFYYTDTKAGSFVATVTMLRIVDNVAWGAARIDMSSNSNFAGKWVFFKFSDGGRNESDFFWMALVDQATGTVGVRNGITPVEGAFRVSAGNLKIKAR